MRKLLLLLLLGLAHCPHRVWAVGNDNPTGVTGAHNGQITTAGSMDPYTGNGKRSVTDLEVAGSVGAYPLKWTRLLNTREPNGAFRNGWSHSYQWSGSVRFGSKRGDGGGEDFYEGPDARVYYPDGRVMDFFEYPGPIYQSWLGDGPGDRLIPVANGNYELRMRDGGVVVFIVAATHTFSTSSSVDLRAIKIVDPYKQETTLEYDASGQLSRITEPGGRYLQVNYNPGLASVQAFSAEGALIETVSYTYQALTFQGTMGYGYLTQVSYADGAVASYTYQEPNVWKPGYGLIKTCDDMRFAGPMKKIEYESQPSHKRWAWGVEPLISKAEAAEHRK